MNRCEAYTPKRGLRCKREAAFLYATRYICKECAEQLMRGGANPAPTKIKKEKEAVA